jgi:stage II sporulation protein E
MIYNKYLDNDIDEKVGSVFNTIKKVVNFKNILFVLFALLLSTKTFIGDFRPFNYVLLAVASAFEVPLLPVLIASVIGLAIGGYTSSLILLLVFFLLYNLVTAIVNIEGINRKYTIFIKFFASIAILQIVASFITGYLFTDLFKVLSSIISSGIIYLVCVTGMNVILNLKNGFVYTKEESIMMMLTIAMLISSLSSISILGFKVVEIIALIVILIYGWGNGAILGATTGLMIGLSYTCLCDVSMSFVVAIAFSGFISGLLRKFGKIAVVIAFIAGNIYISYYSTGISQINIITCEVLIASVVLFFMPKRVEKKLDNLFDLGRGLETVKNNLLNPTKEAKEKIGAVSEVFSNLADITIQKTKETEQETTEVIKKYILSYVNNTCFACDNINECIDKENLDLTAEYIANKLENGEVIEPEMLKFDCKQSKIIIDNINEIYTNMKITRVLKQRELENTEKVSKQYKEVSKLLNTIVENIKEGSLVKDDSQKKLREELKFYGYNVYEDEFIKDVDSIEYTFITDILTDIDKQKRQITQLATNILEQNMTIKLILNISKTEKSKIKLVSTPKYNIKTEIVSERKIDQKVSGDTYLQMELQDLRKLTVISDGVGSGEDAARSSTAVINILERLLSGGFSEEKAIEIVNSIIKLKGDDELYATLDASIINEKDGECFFIKLGAAPTYLIENGKVVTITSTTIPVGLIDNTDYIPICKKLSEGDFIIQVSDGVIVDDMDPNNNYLKNYLSTCDIQKSAKVIAQEIREVLYLNNGGILDDDATIIVNKIEKN